MKSEKAEAPKEQPAYRGYTACTASPFCRYPGRIPMNGRYVCIEHYAADPARHNIPNWELGRRDA